MFVCFYTFHSKKRPDSIDMYMNYSFFVYIVGTSIVGCLYGIRYGEKKTEEEFLLKRRDSVANQIYIGLYKCKKLCNQILWGAVGSIVYPVIFPFHVSFLGYKLFTERLKEKNTIDYKS